VTNSNGRFEFKIPMMIGNLKVTPTGKIVRVSMPGFLTKYYFINDGIPLGKGDRVNQLVYLELPKDIVVDVVDVAGNPVAARIVVGEDFNWADTKSITTTSVGSNGLVNFKVIREFA